MGERKGVICFANANEEAFAKHSPYFNIFGLVQPPQVQSNLFPTINNDLFLFYYDEVNEKSVDKLCFANEEAFAKGRTLRERERRGVGRSRKEGSFANAKGEGWGVRENNDLSRTRRKRRSPNILHILIFLG